MNAESTPPAICGYPIPGWRLDYVQWDERTGQPDGWIVALKRDDLDWHLNRRSVCVMARSDLGPLEAWDEALKIALREDVREAERQAQGTEARRAETVKQGSVHDGPVRDSECAQPQEPSS